MMPRPRYFSASVVQPLVLLVLPSASLLGLIVGQWEGLMMGEEVVLSPPLLWSCLRRSKADSTCT